MTSPVQSRKVVGLPTITIETAVSSTRPRLTFFSRFRTQKPRCPKKEKKNKNKNSHPQSRANGFYPRTGRKKGLASGRLSFLRTHSHSMRARIPGTLFPTPHCILPYPGDIRGGGRLEQHSRLPPSCPSPRLPTPHSLQSPFPRRMMSRTGQNSCARLLEGKTRVQVFCATVLRAGRFHARWRVC